MSDQPSYQWVKFKPNLRAPDVEPDVWMAQICIGYRKDGVFLHASDIELALSDVSVFGTLVDIPSKRPARPNRLIQNGTPSIEL